MKVKLKSVTALQLAGQVEVPVPVKKEPEIIEAKPVDKPTEPKSAKDQIGDWMAKYQQRHMQKYYEENQGKELTTKELEAEIINEDDEADSDD